MPTHIEDRLAARQHIELQAPRAERLSLVHAAERHWRPSKGRCRSILFPFSPRIDVRLGGHAIRNL